MSSPETARRAVCLLADMGIVEAEKGSGVEILSVEAAARYLQELTGVETMTQLRAAIRADLEEQVRIAAEIKDKVSELMDRAERFQHLNPFNPFEITVEAGSICDGRTLAQVNFWQNTTATVIAIAQRRRADDLPRGPAPRCRRGMWSTSSGTRTPRPGWTASSRSAPEALRGAGAFAIIDRRRQAFLPHQTDTGRFASAEGPVVRLAAPGREERWMYGSAIC